MYSRDRISKSVLFVKLHDSFIGGLGGDRKLIDVIIQNDGLGFFRAKKGKHRGEKPAFISRSTQPFTCPV